MSCVCERLKSWHPLFSHPRRKKESNEPSKIELQTETSATNRCNAIYIIAMEIMLSITCTRIDTVPSLMAQTSFLDLQGRLHLHCITDINTITKGSGVNNIIINYMST